MQSDSESLEVESSASALDGLGATPSVDVSELEARLRLQTGPLSVLPAGSPQVQRPSVEESIEKDRRIAKLEVQVDALKQRKSDLARKVDFEQEVREQVNGELRRLQEKASEDLQAWKSYMNSLHQKEVALLQERLVEAEERSAKLQSRLEQEEQSRQNQQLSQSRVRAELQNEITELTGSLKLKSFEVERTAFALEELSARGEKLDAENRQLRKQMEVMRQEFYTLEVDYKEGRASERAELMSLREQLKGYLSLEKELDATIEGCASAPTADAQEALLIGSALGTAPASAQRRIQQSLLLAQELQKKGREARETASKLEKAEMQLASLQEELEAARLEARAAQVSQPQVYLHTALREQKAENGRLKREVSSCQRELEAAQRQAEQAHMARLRVEEDLRKLLVQRQHLEELRNLMQAEGKSEAVKPQMLLRA